MRNFIAIFIAAMICGFSANAQVSFGVKAGISIAMQDIKYSYIAEDIKEAHIHSVESVSGGIFVNIPVPGLPLSIQPELLYVLKGSDANGIIYSEPFKDTIRLHYLELPILLKYSFPTPIISLYIFAGPVFNYLISNKGEEQYTKPYIFSGPASVVSTDFGTTVGGGINFDFLATQCTLDARYTFGLTNIYNVSGGYFEETYSSIRNRAWMIMLGAGF